MTKINKMNQLVADLLYLNVKFHNLHWNVVGMEFVSIHEFTESAYTDLFEKYDEMAERLKMLGEFPKASIKEYADLTNIKELDDKNYTPGEVLNIVEESFDYLKFEFTMLRELAEADDDFLTVALAEDYLSGFEKNIWFIKSMRK